MQIKLISFLYPFSLQQLFRYEKSIICYLPYHITQENFVEWRLKYFLANYVGQ